jgi:hypothetical protein
MIYKMKNYLQKIKSVTQKLKHLRSKSHHYVLNYYGRSSHKQTDIRELEYFGKTAEQVINSGKTYLYYDRLYTLFNALLNIHQNDSIKDKIYLAEIGVFKGGGSFFISNILNQLGLDNYKLFAIDTFEGHSKLDFTDDITDGIQKPGDFNETSYEVVKSYLNAYPNISVLKGRIQDVSNLLTDFKFSLLHFDMDIYQPTIYSLNFFDDKLLPGAIIILDDYGFITCPGIKKAVDEFINTHNRYTRFPLLTGQCILVKY